MQLRKPAAPVESGVLRDSVVLANAGANLQERKRCVFPDQADPSLLVFGYIVIRVEPFIGEFHILALAESVVRLEQRRQ